MEIGKEWGVPARGVKKKPPAYAAEG